MIDLAQDGAQDGFCDRFHGCLCLSLAREISVWMTHGGKKPEQLDKDQRKIVELELKGSHLVLGPPGSGKTNLILLRATYMVRAGKPNVLILLFTRTLQEFLKSGSSEYSFSTDKIQTYFGWGKRLLFENGIDLEESGFEARRKELITKISKLVKEQKLKDMYDAILLDEAHDYLPEEIDTFRRLSKALFAVADSRQKIYKIPDCIEALKSATDKVHLLKYHYRNGIAICRLADEVAKPSELYEPMTGTANYDESKAPSSVEFFRCKDIEEQGEKIIKALMFQMKAYPKQLLGVLVPKA